MASVQPIEIRAEDINESDPPNDGIQSEHCQRLLARRHPGTCKWLLDSVKYQDWRKSSDTPSGSFLWVLGSPGCGKTVAIAAVIEDVQKLQADVAVAYHFFRRGDGEGTALSTLLLSLIGQLTNEPDTVDGSHEAAPSASAVTIEDLMPQLQAVIRTDVDTYLIIDALEACSGLAELLICLRTMHDWQLGRLHVFISSRLAPGVNSAMTTYLSSDQIIAMYHTPCPPRPTGLLALVESRMAANTDRPHAQDLLSYVQASLSNDADFPFVSNGDEVMNTVQKRILDESCGL